MPGSRGFSPGQRVAMSTWCRTHSPGSNGFDGLDPSGRSVSVMPSLYLRRTEPHGCSGSLHMRHSQVGTGRPATRGRWRDHQEGVSDMYIGIGLGTLILIIILLIIIF